MDDRLRTALLRLTDFAYQSARPLIFTQSPQKAHEDVLKLLALLDDNDAAQAAIRTVQHTLFKTDLTEVGGIRIPYPMILAAGFVKGEGFANEVQARAAVQRGKNIIPGWRTMPNLVGLVEFGSFTRWPRLGNPGTVMWRDVKTHSTQNRVGLKNPGVNAAAYFLAQHRRDLPPFFGINIALGPGLDDPEREKQEVIEALDAFLSQHIYPSWFTLNLSCPNTEDDPGNNQTEDKTRLLCEAAITQIRSSERDIPLWVKVSPGLADSQYHVLMRVFHETGVHAVIATNTLPQPTPEDTTLTAGIGGGRLHDEAVHAASILAAAKQTQGYDVDIIGCGGVLDYLTYQDFVKRDIHTIQYWSALIYRGPLAAALIPDKHS